MQAPDRSVLMCLHLPVCEIGIILVLISQTYRDQCRYSPHGGWPQGELLHRMLGYHCHLTCPLLPHPPEIPGVSSQASLSPDSPPGPHSPLISHPCPSLGSPALAQGPRFPTAVSGT